jgi:hypothetical protein
MKIALCLHGLFDSFTDSTSKGVDGYNYIKKHILDGNDVDVFVHSWEPYKKFEIVKLYNPKNTIFEEQINFKEITDSRGLNNLKRTPRPPERVLSHLYSVTKSIILAIEDDTKYDIIIKSRFDLGRINRNTSGPNKHNPYPVQCINFKKDIDVNKIYMANWNHFHMGPADMWFYGSERVMSNFKDLYTVLLNQYYIGSEFHKFSNNIENHEGNLCNAIAFYKYWMVSNGLWDNKEVLDTKWE